MTVFKAHDPNTTYAKLEDATAETDRLNASTLTPKEEPKAVYPSIHMNGTNPTDLLNEAIECNRAVREAIEVIANRGPNARDYYPQGPNAFAVARAAHVARLSLLQTVLNQLEQIAEHIADNTPEQRKPNA